MPTSRHTATIAGLVLASPGRVLAAGPAGTWQTSYGQARIHTEHCGSDEARHCAYLVWIQHPFDSQEETILDMGNPDPGERREPVLGEGILADLRPGERARHAGQVHDPGHGDKPDVVLWSEGAETLSVMGCAPETFCGTQTWTLASDPTPDRLGGLTGSAHGLRVDE